LSIKTSLERLPEIKKNGYFTRFFQDKECKLEESFGFVTDKVCYQSASSLVFNSNFKMENYKSVLYHFNTVKNIAENIGYLGNNCDGQVVQKLEYIPGKCYPNGPINFMKIEKN
jgi:hypothetical protein